MVHTQILAIDNQISAINLDEVTLETFSAENLENEQKYPENQDKTRPFQTPFFETETRPRPFKIPFFETETRNFAREIREIETGTRVSSNPVS